MTGRLALKNYLLALVALILFLPLTATAQEELCAEVKIEIKQELTFERQGFEALMRIENSLDSFSIEDINVTVNFEDALGQPVVATSNTSASDASFFIRLDGNRDVTGLTEGQGGAVSGGSIAPNHIGEIRWLIIPTATAAGDSQNGELFYVGAELSYRYGGKEESLSVAPDSIVVKPQPALTLDYFLTRDIIADDAFTIEVEPPEPYTLGVRITNSGFGWAGDVKIESAQPTIVENKQGLAIDFVILASYVGNAPAEPTLIADFGDIAPKKVAMGRWLMQSSLAGEFTAFSASFTHADELGGELTSLLEATSARFLQRDVLIDSPGRDNVRDFLAYNEHDELYVYESENTGLRESLCSNCAPVTVQPGSLAATGQTHRLTYNPLPEFTYTKVADPYAGQQVLARVVRSDGKLLNPQNAWLSKERAEDDRSFNFFINVLDTQTTGEYTLYWGGDKVDLPQPPALAFMPNRVTHEEGQLGFIVRASDPNNTMPALDVQQLPAGATFDDNGNGTGVFNWVPAIGQSGVYAVTFIASDGQLTANRSVTITVNPFDDTDGDGMNDAWEMEHFGTLERDGTGDFDGDGRTDLQEFTDGTEPTVAEVVPGKPQILSPAFDAEVLDGAAAPWLPELAVTNGVHSEAIGQVLVMFEVYRDEAMTEQVAAASTLEALDETRLQLAEEHLVEDVQFFDNRFYYWRARAVSKANAAFSSAWVTSRFFINSANDAPLAPVVDSPADGFEVEGASVTLVVFNGTDVDKDYLYYSFELYEDTNLESPLAELTGQQQGRGGKTQWQVPKRLNNAQGYLWRAQVTDEHGLVSSTDWSSFTLAGDDPALLPTAPTPISPSNNKVFTGSLEPIRLLVANGSEPEGQPLTYWFELDTTDSFNGPNKVESGAVSEMSDQTYWDTPVLTNNTTYYWRARVDNGIAKSPWVGAKFSLAVATQNLAPPIPTLNGPLDGVSLANTKPFFELNPVLDPEGDAVFYDFELYADAALAVLEARHESGSAHWQLEAPLIAGVPYYWRYRSVDGLGNSQGWAGPFSFIVTSPGPNKAPEFEFVEPGGKIKLLSGAKLNIQWQDEDPDSSALISLYYRKGGQSRVKIAGDLAEDADGEGDRYVWKTIGLRPGKYYLEADITDEDGTVSVGPWGHINIMPWKCQRKPTNQELQKGSENKPCVK